MVLLASSQGRRDSANVRINAILDGGYRGQDEDKASSRRSDRQKASRIGILYDSGINDPMVRHRASRSSSPVRSPTERAYQRDTTSSPNKQQQLVENRNKWYVGYTNHVSAPVTTDAAGMIPRYGASGAVKMLSTKQSAGIYSNKSTGLSYLDPPSVPSPYHHSLISESPSQWSPDSAYVTGSNLEFRPTRGINSSTSSGNRVPEESAQQSYGKAVQRVEDVRQDSLLALEQSLIDETKIHKKNLEKTKIKLEKEAKVREKKVQYFSDPSAHIGHKHSVKVLRDSSIMLRKSKGFSSTDNTSAAVSEEYQMRRYTLRSKYLRVLNTAMVRARRLHDLQRIQKLAMSDDIGGCANNLHGPFTLTRDQFIALLTNEYRTLISESDASRLYSGFDPDRQSAFDIRELVGSLKVLRSIGDATKRTLLDLWNSFDINDGNTLGYPTVKTMLTLFCNDADEEKRMTSIVEQVFLKTKDHQDYEMITLDQFTKAVDHNESDVTSLFIATVNHQKKLFKEE